jgi:hypothetical protein
VENAGLDLMFLGSKEVHIIWRTKGTVRRNSHLRVSVMIIYIVYAHLVLKGFRYLRMA